MDKAKKKRIKKYLSWISLALVVALLAAMPLMAKAEVEEDGPVASVHSGTVEKGQINTTLHGGGTLTTDDAQDVTLPSGVKITEFLVKNGDLVTEGTPLAAVDKVSVMTAIVEVKETMEYLQKEIDSVRNEKVSGTISATAGGRVKQVFAQVGDSVQDVMMEHGALAVLSLDGLMAVRIEKYVDISTGDSVTVSFPDGSEAEGRVESNLDGVLIITVEDEDYAIGETVTVETEDGEKVGIGQLYIHNAWKATAFTGTISAVYAKEERTVYSGSTLFTLKDTDFKAGMEYMAKQHRDYEELMQDLFQMYESGAILAPCDGQISGVEEDSEFLLAGEAVEWEAMPLAAREEKGWTIMLLSAEGTGGENPGTGSGEGTGEGSGEGETDSGTYTGYPGKVTHIGATEVILAMSDQGAAVTKTEEGGWDLSQVSLDTQTMIHTGMTFAVGDTSSYEVGDIVVVIYDESGNYSVAMAQKANPEPDPMDPNNPGFPGFPGDTGGFGGMGGFDISGLLGSFGGMGSMGGYTGATEETEPELFDLEGDVLMTVTPQETVSLTITLDEQDIAKVSVGMIAEVKVEALRGEVFEAEVTEVAISGTNNGGSSKFTAKLVMDKAENMLDGMSATAALPLYTKLDVLTIPVKALVEDGAKTMVCTALDPETGEPASAVEVTIGMSDGITAEVISGLGMGDTYYYSYYDVLELDTNAEVSRYSFG